MMRVTIVVTHLLGTGHLSRALTLARAFADANNTVTVISGGVPVPHFDTRHMRFIQLPPLRSDGTNFTNLLKRNGTPASQAYLSDRSQQLIQHTQDSAPDVLMTELFPFGRRVLKDEFLFLLEAIKQLHTPPLVLSSIRDILAPPSKPSKVTFAQDVLDRHFDGVIVHSDPNVVPLDTSWPVNEDLQKKLNYSGFVAPPPPSKGSTREAEIIVSAGGGSVGDLMFKAACEAASEDRAHAWRLLVGGDDNRRQAMAENAPANVMINAPRPDFRQLLRTAAASVSMCGYNTALDVLQTGVPAVFVPFDDGGEVEQGLRAHALSKLQGISVLKQSDMTAQSLSEQLTYVLNTPPRAPIHEGMNGAKQTVEITRKLLESKTHAL